MPHNPERAAFFRAIREAPANARVPRLVYADWLEERGEGEQAEFIRLQCREVELLDSFEFNRIRRSSIAQAVFAEFLANHIRQTELLARHRTEWLGSAARRDGNDARLGPVFGLGLPERIVLSLEELLTVGESIFAEFPTIRELAVYGMRNRGDELAACELISNFETLELADLPTPADTSYLLQSPWFGGQSVIRTWALHDYRETFLQYLVLSRWKPAGRFEVVDLVRGMPNREWYPEFFLDLVDQNWGKGKFQAVNIARNVWIHATGQYGWRTGQRGSDGLQMLSFEHDGWYWSGKFTTSGVGGHHLHFQMIPVEHREAGPQRWFEELFQYNPKPIWLEPFGIVQRQNSMELSQSSDLNWSGHDTEWARLTKRVVDGQRFWLTVNNHHRVICDNGVLTPD